MADFIYLFIILHLGEVKRLYKLHSSIFIRFFLWLEMAQFINLFHL